MNFTHDEETTARISEQRDRIYDWCVDRFKVLMAEDRVDDALYLADEFFEWMDPNQLEEEDTLFADYGLGQLN